MSQRTKDKIMAILKILDSPVVNVDKLKLGCRFGIPDECKGLRSLCWRLLLGYLPPDKAKWVKRIEETKKHFFELQDEQFKL